MVELQGEPTIRTGDASVEQSTTRHDVSTQTTSNSTDSGQASKKAVIVSVNASSEQSTTPYGNSALGNSHSSNSPATSTCINSTQNSTNVADAAATSEGGPITRTPRIRTIERRPTLLLGSVSKTAATETGNLHGKISGFPCAGDERGTRASHPNHVDTSSQHGNVSRFSHAVPVANADMSVQVYLHPGVSVLGAFLSRLQISQDL